MKITLLKAFPDDYRQSMRIYEQRLSDSLESVLKPEDRVETFLPPGVMTSPKPMRYFSQYLWYPIASTLQQSDIFHITDHSYAHLAFSLPPRKTVVTFHDAIWLKTKNGQYSEKIEKISSMKRFNLNAIARTEAVICDSKASRQALLDVIHIPIQKTHVVYPGCEPLVVSKTKEEARALLGLSAGTYLLHVGHNQAYKNIPGLIRVFAILKKNIPSIRLLKVGTAFESGQTALISSLNLGDSITHLGVLDFERLKLVYRAADALLLPSLDEGFGFPVLEAMSLDLPVVSSNRGSLPEVMGNAGLMTAPEDYEGLAHHVEKLLTGKALREEKIAAGRVQSKKFQWQDTAQKIYSIYREVFNKR